MSHHKEYFYSGPVSISREADREGVTTRITTTRDHVEKTLRMAYLEGLMYLDRHPRDKWGEAVSQAMDEWSDLFPKGEEEEKEAWENGAGKRKCIFSLPSGKEGLSIKFRGEIVFVSQGTKYVQYYCSRSEMEGLLRENPSLRFEEFRSGLVGVD